MVTSEDLWNDRVQGQKALFVVTKLDACIIETKTNNIFWE